MARKRKNYKRGKNNTTKAGTRKYQGQGPTTWLPKLLALAAKVPGGKGSVSVGVRAAIAKGLGEPWRPDDYTRAVYLVKGRQTRIEGT